VLLVAFGVLAATGADANPDDSRVPPVATPSVVRCLLAPVQIERLACDSAILVEADTGAVLFEKEADQPRAPASLVKTMVELIVLREIDAGTIALGDTVVTSRNASTMGGSQVYLAQGEKQTVRALLEALMIASANDAAMALAEFVAGDEASFVARMNVEAEALGCTSTRFANVHGLDLRWQAQNLTSARDIATIARELVRHPLALEISSTRRLPFRDGEFWLDNTNHLLRKYEGLDGLKTGYTPRAGGCFCGTAVRDGVRLVAVVMNAHPGGSRFRVTSHLLDAGFAGRPRWVQAVAPNERLPLAPTSLPLGSLPPNTSTPAPSASAIARGSVLVLLEESRQSGLERRVRTVPDFAMPSTSGGLLGYVDCRLDDHTFASVPAHAGDPVPVEATQ
jgi:D-alanyl-D-alanine carboxypeptidase (penicillin-binding protein 5/6)